MQRIVAVRTDAAGNGWASLPDIPLDRIRAVSAIVPSPDNQWLPGYHRPVARVIDLGGNASGVQVTGWFPSSTASVLVAHV